ncbi:uncharacterized protein EDB93DRAFT_87926 [Suillus bovinus]|uniref:uncharacterized protein n=1 Tax=Suillus bovinus TaxID=48563 RepID=UPI001B869B8A|nr:uncharacterized protein EDB93DRAFT_87926 [Suillus bovinus]KAG2130158.1 hypothetical protein EDB93DRAFT_87926 [Suillus bovinus]
MSTTSFNIDSEYRIDDLCKLVLGNLEYQQVGDSDGTPGTAPPVKTSASKYGKALIHKLELLKDTRFSHWRHEFIVLTLTYASERRVLYLEHSWHGGAGLGERIPVTLSSLFSSQKGSADEAMFYKPNDPHEDHRRKCTMTLLEIQFSDHPTHSPVTLHSIARILRQMGTKHKAYALFSANCWAWSRGIAMAVAIESSSNVEIVTMSGRDVTLHQLKIYLLTEYGAFGGLLLHCIEKGRHDLRWHEYCTLRFACFLYGFIDLGLWFKHVIFGPLNWVLRVKELCIYNDRTTDMNDQDHTYTLLPPDFTDLFPTFPGISTHTLGSRFCGPSKYLYILVPPIATPGARITSVHVFLYGTVESEPGQEQSASVTENTLNRMEWFQCAILRPTPDGRLIEVSEPACFSLSVQFRSESGRRSYGAVHIMEHHHPLTLGLRQGDLIAIWALGRAGFIHKPAGAWIKVVTNYRLGILDWLVTMHVAKTIAGLILYPRGHTWLEIVIKCCHELKYLFIEIPWCLNSFCSDWPWSAINMAASHLLSTVTPLQLPEDNGDSDEHPVEVTLSNFIEQLLSPNGGKGSPFCRAIIHSISFAQAEIDLFKIIVLLVTLDNVKYYVHICHPKDEESLWHHFITSLWSSHGLMQDTVVIYRQGKMQRAAWKALDVDFTAELSDSDTAASQSILSVALHLRNLRNNYWWYFWLNENWQWPIFIVKAIMKCSGEIVRLQLQCDEEPLQIDKWEQTNDLLGDKVEGWIHAEGRIYGNGMKDDILFLFVHARARFLIWSGILISFFLHVYYHF